MSFYSLQEELNSLAVSLDIENKERLELLDRATRIQDNFLYKKEAHQKRPPRHDLRKGIKDRSSKPTPEYKKVWKKKRKTAEAIINSASSFSIPVPNNIALKTKEQYDIWNSSIEKVASMGKLVLKSGVPNYDAVISIYLNASVDSVKNAFYVKTARYKGLSI